jgi:hypothetical protein
LGLIHWLSSKLTRRRQVAGAFVTLSLLAGCFTATLTAPAHWAEPRRTDSPCRDIAGVYDNLGETTPEVNWRPNLADALLARVHIASAVPTLREAPLPSALQSYFRVASSA